MSTPTSVLPYLNFDGRCDEAAAFYQQAVGAEIGMVMRFKDSPEPPQEGCVPPGSGEKVMHMSMTIAGSTILASDCHCAAQPKFEGFSLAMNLPTVAEVEKAFAALADGGQVCMPLEKTFWAVSFGVVTDRFGVTWMIMCEKEQAA